MEFYEYKDQEKELFEKHSSKLCVCECSVCANRSPHPVYNCYKKCENVPELTEKEKLEIGLYKTCVCDCNHCALSIYQYIEI